VPYPYVKNPDKSVSLPDDRLATVRRIYDMLVMRQLPYGDVVSTLNRERIPAPRGAWWNTASIRNILSNPLLRGRIVYGRHTREQTDQVVAPSRYPAVFTLDESMAIDAELGRRSAMRRGATSRRPWTGIVICNRCGWHMSCTTNRSGNVYYRCSQHQVYPRSGRDGCHPNLTALHRIQRAALGTVWRYTTLDRLAIAQLLLQQNSGRAQLEQRIADANAGVARVDQERERLTTAYLRGILPIDEFEVRMGSLTAELETLRSEGEALKRQLAVTPAAVMRLEELVAMAPKALYAMIYELNDRKLLHDTFREIRCENGRVVSVSLRW
jgi:hypothetical protein